jgi:ribosomal protein L20
MTLEERKESARLRSKAWYAANKGIALDRQKAYRLAHPDLMKARSKTRYQANRDKILAKQKEHYATTKAHPRKLLTSEERIEHAKRQRKEWCERNPDKVGKWEKEHPEEVKAIKKKWMDNNPGKRKEVTARYRKANREKSKTYGRAYMARKRKEDPEGEKAKLKAWRQGNLNFKVSKALRGRVNCAIRKALGSNGKKCDHTMTLVGCTVKEVIVHIERQFRIGMTWDNWGNKEGFWNIDHIRPCASFDLRDHVQQRQCFHWTNIQPLWWRENMEKGNKWDDPNQAA